MSPESVTWVKLASKALGHSCRSRTLWQVRICKGRQPSKLGWQEWLTWERTVWALIGASSCRLRLEAVRGPVHAAWLFQGPLPSRLQVRSCMCRCMVHIAVCPAARELTWFLMNAALPQ